MNKIILKGIKNRIGEKIYFLFIVLVITATLFSTSYLLDCFKNGINSVSERIGADIIVVPNGYASNVQNSLFTGEPSTVYFKNNWLDTLKGIQGVEKVSKQIFLASLSNSPCCDLKSQLIAIDYNSDFVIKPWLLEAYNKDLASNEVLVGSGMDYSIGEEVVFYEKKFKVVGKTDKSGMGYDRSVFMSYEAANELFENPKVNDSFQNIGSNEAASAYYIRVSDPSYITKITAEINEKIQGEEIKVYTSDSMIMEVRSNINKFSNIFIIVQILFIIIALIGIIGIYSLDIYNRRREFGILYSIGSKRRHIAIIILGEVFYISLAGGIIGVVFGGIFVFSFSNYISSILGLPFYSPSLIDNLLLIIKCLILGIGTSLIAAILAIIKNNCIEVSSLIKENET